jgi:hypothetical protein
VQVENNKLQQMIQNVQVEVESKSCAIAPFLNRADVVVLDKAIDETRIMWDMPGCKNCFQLVAVESSLAGLKAVIHGLAPFKARIVVENRAKTAVSGEMKTRNGPIALFGLNSLQFNNIAPGKAETLDGSFMALEEGRLTFQAFQVAIRDGHNSKSTQQTVCPSSDQHFDDTTMDSLAREIECQCESYVDGALTMNPRRTSVVITEKFSMSKLICLREIHKE